MGWVLKYCKKCNKVYLGPDSNCPTCHSELLVSKYDSDTYKSLSTDNKEQVLFELFGASEDSSNHGEDSLLTTTVTSSNEGTSTVGGAIKVVSVIVLVLSVIGSFIVMGDLGAPLGIACLLVNLLVGLLAYGIGVICSLLARIDSKLAKLVKGKETA